MLASLPWNIMKKKKKKYDFDILDIQLNKQQPVWCDWQTRFYLTLVIYQKLFL